MKISWQELKITWLHWYHQVPSPKLRCVNITGIPGQKDTPHFSSFFLPQQFPEKYKALFCLKGTPGNKELLPIKR